MFILLVFAFLAGFVTVLSPCILPVLPILLSAGAGQGRFRPLGIMLGLVISFSFFTLTLTALVHATGVSPDALRYIAIALIIFFGLTMVFPKLGNFFAAATAGIATLGTRVQERSSVFGQGFVGGFMLGAALGLIWTPCAGPILATITTLVATSAVDWYTVLITVAYSIGAALPMVAITYGGAAIINSTRFLSAYAELIRKIFGVLMILGAVAIALHADVALQQFVVNYLPTIKIEENAMVKNALSGLRPHGIVDRGSVAPELVGITGWINTQPLTLAQLRGKVVLVDFWTYSCINCVRTLPYLKKWYDAYKDKGFVIIGVHTPEFEFEKNLANVQDAVRRFGITYPVALDSNYATWQNYDNHYWPAHYLIDKNGIIQEMHFGEGNYQETENAIRTLLGLPATAEKDEQRMMRHAVTPETYLGYRRANAYIAQNQIKADTTQTYTYTQTLGADAIGLKGSWYVAAEFIRAEGADSRLDFNFGANRVYLVMESPTPQFVTVLVDGAPVAAKYHTVDMNKEGKVAVNQARMYDILDLKGDDRRHTLSLQVPKDVSLYAFTFGEGEK